MVIRVKCKRQRTILDLFAFWSCDNCKEIRQDEVIAIGQQIIGIYYLHESCYYVEVSHEELFAFSKKLKQLLEEAMVVQDDIVLFILDNFSLEQMEDILEAFLDINLDIQIIIE